MKNKSVMLHDFARVPQANIERSVFDRSHKHLTAFDSDYLIPVLLDEFLPGDSFNLDCTVLARLATPLTPIMDNLKINVYFFAIPNRLIWDNWSLFMGERTDASTYDPADYTVPLMAYGASAAALHSLGDYFGLPAAGHMHSIAIALPFRAYNLVYNEWFRTPYLIAAETVDKDNGPDDIADYVLLKRNKEPDYFTSCLPSVGFGPEIELSLGTSAPVSGIGFLSAGDNTGNILQNQSVEDQVQGLSSTYEHAYIDESPGQLALEVNEDTANAYPIPYADLATAVGPTITELRESIALQHIYEKDMRSGQRYVEIIKSHFNVVHPSERWRSEYLGGGTVYISVVPVAQTTQSGLTGGSTKQGSLTGYGVGQGSNIGFTKSFTEHGWILGLACLTGDKTYSQGIHRSLTRQTRWDYYWPDLVNLSEQAVLNQEIWYGDVPGTGAAQDQGTFGYQERYAEYKYFPSRVSGIFRPDASGTLSMWHLSQDFAALPTLNQTFIEETLPLDRCIAVSTEPHVIADFYFKYRCARPIPVFSVPGLKRL